MFWDAAPGMSGYVAARSLGATPVLALVAASVATGIRAIVMSVRLRRIDGVALLVLATLLGGCALTLVTGSVRLLLVKDSMMSAVGGITFLASAASHAPLAWQFMLRSAGADAAGHRQRWSMDAGYRRTWRLITAVWGGGLCMEALARVPIALWLPLDRAALVSSIMSVPTVGGLLAWTLWYRRHTAPPELVASVA